MKGYVKLYHQLYKNIQQGWFNGDLGLKSVTYVVCFTILPLFLRFSLIFMNMQISKFVSLAMG